MSFAEFAQREIFAPLGMANTHVNDDLSRIVPGRAEGYSGVFTTIEDLAKWARSFETHAPGGPELTALLLRPERFAHPKANDAFGLVWGDFRGRRTLWYEGGDLGYSSYMARLPDDCLGVIVLSNLGTGRAAERARRVLEVLVPVR